jgi:TPR repeat protein
MVQTGSTAESGAKPADSESQPLPKPVTNSAVAGQEAAPRPDPEKKGSGASKRSKKPDASAMPSLAPGISEARVREFMRLSVAQIEQRIVEQRQILRHDSGNDAARQSLGLISVELANRILEFEAVERKQEIVRLIALIRKDLHDTFWRVSQLAKTDGRAAAALGLFFSEGILTARAPDKGCDAYVQAAQLNHVNAAYQAGLCKSGTDPGLAKTLIECAAAEGHPGAEELMGRACIEGEKKDSACALYWLERAAAKGRPSAMSLVGWIYANDPQRLDLAKAVKYYRAAADADDAAAQNNLGEFYETGRGVSPNAAQAFSWYARAAEAGFPAAQLNLARLYAAGTGVARSPDHARQWAERAQKQGQAQAQDLLDWLAAQH